eukprot:4934017-Heterocapsa_arctica.AAC.1
MARRIRTARSWASWSEGRTPLRAPRAPAATCSSRHCRLSRSGLPWSSATPKNMSTRSGSSVKVSP